jgi:tripartite-type tricarboxylate transporter receptor subunit TctC
MYRGKSAALKKPVARPEDNAMRKALVLVVAVLAAATVSARADGYPSRVITLVVPFPAGGPTDVVARVLADRMKQPDALGETVIIENVAGAGGSIGVGRVAHATANGYTIVLGHVQTHVFNAVTMHLDYDVVKDFDPVALVSDSPILLIARKTLPAADLKSFIAWLKARDGRATMGHVGIGGPTDVAADVFANRTGTAFQRVPYTGGAPLLQDLLGDHIDFAFGFAANYLSFIRNHELKAYGVLQPKRWWAAPDVPTFNELGIPDIDTSFWQGIWAPKGTPKNVIAKLNAAIRVALADPAVQKRFAAVGQDIWPADQQTPEALAAKQKAEIAKWWPIIKATGVKAE